MGRLIQSSPVNDWWHLLCSVKGVIVPEEAHYRFHVPLVLTVHMITRRPQLYILPVLPYALEYPCSASENFVARHSVLVILQVQRNSREAPKDSVDP